jgi:putative flavoprotein involved in K+ transport
MLQSQVPQLGPIQLRLDPDETPSQADGVTQGWILLETGIARGKGYLRLRGKIWTLLTTAAELKGHEEPKGVTARAGRCMACIRSADLEGRARSGGARTGLPAATVLPHHRRRAGWHRAGRAAAPAGRAHHHHRRNERAGDSWRKRYKSLCLHDPVWYDHLPYIPFPRTGPSSRPRTRSATGWKCTPR